MTGSVITRLKESPTLNLRLESYDFEDLFNIEVGQEYEMLLVMGVSAQISLDFSV